MIKLNKVADEWSYRVGTIDFKNPVHIVTLIDILREGGWSEDAISEYVSNIDNVVEYRRYLKPGEKAPAGVAVKTSTSGKSYYEKTPGGKKKKDDKIGKKKKDDKIGKKKKKKKETAAQRDKRREDRIDNDTKDINAIKDPIERFKKMKEMANKRRADIYSGNDLPAGTAGSTLGEMCGGIAAEDIGDPDNPNISEEEFIDREYDKIMAAKGDPSLKDKLCKNKKPNECEKAVKGWLEIAYKTGLNELNALKDPKYKAKNPQESPFPSGHIMDYHGKDMVKNELENKLEDAKQSGNEKAVKHYEKQLRRVGVPKFNEDGSPNTDELGETDTGVMYMMEDGKIGFKHTSNKKSLSDPHYNKSISSKKVSMNEAAGRQKERGVFPTETIDDITNTINTTTDEANKLVTRADRQVNADVSDVKDKDALIKGGAKLLNKLPGRGAITGEAYADKVRSGKDYAEIRAELERMYPDIPLEDITEEQILEANLSLIKHGSPATNKASGVVTKEREKHKKRIAELQKKIDDGEELSPQEEAEMGEAKEALAGPVHTHTDKDGKPHYATIVEVDGKEEIRNCDAEGNPIVSTDSTKLLYKMSEVIKTTRKNAAKQDPPLTEESSDEELEEFGKFYNPPLSAEEVKWMLFSDEADTIKNSNDDRKSGMDRAHKKIVDACNTKDQEYFENNQAEAEKMGWVKKDGVWEKTKGAKNGPATQQYIDSYMDDMHWNRYIDGEHDGVGDMSINGQNVTPKDFRTCMAKLSGHIKKDKGESDEDYAKRADEHYKDHDNRKALKKHLREQTRISAEIETKEGDKREGRVSTESQQAHISFDNEVDVLKKKGGKMIPTGEKRKVSIGEEAYRSKGIGVNSVLGGLGKDMQGCLQGEMNRSNK